MNAEVTYIEPIAVQTKYDADGNRSYHLIGEWPEWSEIDSRLIREGDKTLIWQEGDEIHFQLTDTSAVYQMVAETRLVPDRWTIRLIEKE